jgi:uncharacterized Ntn-hydrolase superfamily protein
MTFTILGCCPRTGRLGGAVTTSDVAVGARVLFGQAGVGMAATQHRTDPRLGPALLDRLQGGSAPEQAVADVAGGTMHRAWRQLGVVDARGRCGAYSGDRVWPLCAELAGEDCLVIGNMLSGPAVAPAMRDAFAQRAGDDLCDRLLAALDAGERAGGEAGGSGLRSARHCWWSSARTSRSVDLRIDADPEPLPASAPCGRPTVRWRRRFVARALTPDAVHRSSSTTT